MWRLDNPAASSEENHIPYGGQFSPAHTVFNQEPKPCQVCGKPEQLTIAFNEDRACEFCLHWLDVEIQRGWRRRVELNPGHYMQQQINGLHKLISGLQEQLSGRSSVGQERDSTKVEAVGSIPTTRSKLRAKRSGIKYDPVAEPTYPEPSSRLGGTWFNVPW